MCLPTVNSDDPDTPALNKSLETRTPPASSPHTGIANPQGNLKNIHDDGSTLNLDIFHDASPNLGWDLRVGVTELDGKGSNPGMDIWTISANPKFTVNPTEPASNFEFTTDHDSLL